MRRDPSVFMLGEDIAEYGGPYKVTQGLVDEFGHDRIRNTPLAEAGIAGTALGAALVGMRPIAEIVYIDFAFIAADQIINQIAKLRYMTGGMVKVPLVIRTQGGGGVAAGSHHSQSLEAVYAHIPGLLVVMPSNAYDAKGLLKSSIREDNPVIFIEHKKLYGEACDVPEEEYLVPLGKADVKREGKDITVISYSRCVNLSLNAAEELAKDARTRASDAQKSGQVVLEQQKSRIEDALEAGKAAAKDTKAKQDGAQTKSESEAKS